MVFVYNLDIGGFDWCLWILGLVFVLICCVFFDIFVVVLKMILWILLKCGDVVFFIVVIYVVICFLEFNSVVIFFLFKICKNKLNI